MSTAQPALFDLPAAATRSVNQLRDEAIRRVAERAEQHRRQFLEDARAFVVRYLAEHGPTSGELLTNACKAAGIQAHDDRAMGSVFLTLARRGVIEKCGSVARTKGHNYAGGNVWGLKRA